MAGFQVLPLLTSEEVPEIDGFSVLELLPACLQGKRLPVLVLIARHASDDVRRVIVLPDCSSGAMGP